MDIFLRAVRLLSMVVWVGGLVFFAFVEAPTAFRVMGTTGPFAELIGESIRSLNRIGHLCGFIFLIATAVIAAKAAPRARRVLFAQIILVVLMIAATMVDDLLERIITSAHRAGHGARPHGRERRHQLHRG